MAKAKGGLGRGLGSLLGGMDGTIAQTTASPAVETSDDKPAGSAAGTLDVTSVNEGAESEGTSGSAKDSDKKSKAASKEEAQGEGELSAESAQKADDEIDIDLIEPNPYQPRTNFKKDELEELANSIKANGLISPILVRPYDGKYQIIAGERRWQACKLIGMQKVPVLIKEADDEQTIILALVENIQRSNLNPIEEAYGYRRMMERGKMTQAEVAKAVSKSRPSIANALRLLDLPEEAQQLVYDEKISAGHARAILSIPTKEGRRKLVDRLTEENLTVREAERIAKTLSEKKEQKSVERKPAPKTYRTVARALSDSLGTDVKIKSIKGANLIQINFKDEADLQRLFRAITNS